MDTGLFVDQDEIDRQPTAAHPHAHSPLHEFEHHMKLFVDLGLFFFAFANAGVAFEGIGPMTWLIFGSLVIGKNTTQAPPGRDCLLSRFKLLNFE